MNDPQHVELAQVEDHGIVNDQQLCVHIDQLIAAFFKQLKDGCLENDTRLYVTYPPSFTEHDKEILRNAIRIARIDGILVSEDKAVVNSYVYSHEKEIQRRKVS